MIGSEKLSVIVLMHNNAAMTRSCLESLSRAVTSIDHEIVLLDNASTEDTSELSECGNWFRSFKVCRSDANIPFSEVNNRGARHATGGLLLFLNNDVVVGGESIKHLVAPFRRDRAVGLTGAKLLFPDETRVQHAGIGHMIWGYPTNYGVGASPADERVSRGCERFALTGAMFCITRDIFDRVGGFDERYIWGVEDIDLCLKVRDAGLRIVYEPAAVSIHVESATLKVTQKWDLDHNYRLYRQLWDRELVPREQSYVTLLKRQGIRRVAVFGTGIAARGLAKIFDEAGIGIVAFTSSKASSKGETFLGRPILPLDALRDATYDRLVVATQFFFEVESMLRQYDPLCEPIFPILL
jgi:GT2 family glycosyltransferase